jgi:mannose-6-phosphate isomerase
MTDYYPLLLRAIPHAKVWGGHNLARLLGKSSADEEMIGETWEAWDGCAVENGAHRGMQLRDLIERDAAGILGDQVHGTRFPLLFKFIDAQDDLSVQVHPDDAAAQKIEHYPSGKTEAWYIIHAEANAALIHGFKEDVDAMRVRDALANHNLEDLLCHISVQSGDVVFVPAGTVHAIKRGVVLAEIQENSDITYRLYDWGRVGKGRDLHIEQSLRVARFDKISEHKIPRLTIHHDAYDHHFLVACQYFSYELLDVRRSLRNLQMDKFNILSLIEGWAKVDYGDEFKQSVQVGRGQTLLLPARIGPFEIAPIELPCHLLRAYVPNLRQDVIVPLKRAGYRDKEIADLGGPSPDQNDIRQLL